VVLTRPTEREELKLKSAKSPLTRDSEICYNMRVFKIWESVVLIPT
jgi:hypothetical protein